MNKFEFAQFVGCEPKGILFEQCAIALETQPLERVLKYYYEGRLAKQKCELEDLETTFVYSLKLLALDVPQALNTLHKCSVLSKDQLASFQAYNEVLDHV